MDAGDDWRAQLQPAARGRIVNKIVLTLRKHLPVSVPEGLVELQRIAVRFEDKVYAAATRVITYGRFLSNCCQWRVTQIHNRTPVQVTSGRSSSSKGKKQKKLRCHFCKKGGHFKKDCLKRKIWFEKKKELL
ncbi:mediator of RNA polymerase II transcription subunit 15a-like [Miscanthus floridulus]|uniref:mediator of RNA polymerase II transcription subunit 15a-like n=1 Tax=Miscanthus floridulus TaxID=154761 RepID=UPI00345B0484